MMKVGGVALHPVPCRPGLSGGVGSASEIKKMDEAVGDVRKLERQF